MFENENGYVLNQKRGGNFTDLSLPSVLFSNFFLFQGGTAFYDAVLQICRDSNQGKKKSRETWIIALTDGEDNKSRSSVHDCVNRLKEDKIDAFICICVQVSHTVLENCQILANATPNVPTLFFFFLFLIFVLIF